MRAILLLGAWALAAAAQTPPAFDVASVKPSAHCLGKDHRPFRIEVAGGRFAAHNASLKDLILAAYGIDRYQLTGGPAWLDEDEFDVDTRANGNATPDQIREMLRALLAERFHLAVRKEQKEMQRFALVVDKGGPKIQPAKDGDARGRFHGDMRTFANLLSLQLSIPAMNDPTKPGIANGPPVPVIDETGLQGVYNIDAWPQPELGTEPFPGWQRVLQGELGLRLESKRGPVEMFVVEQAEKAKANE